MARVNGALAAAYGYDPIGTLRATEDVYRHSVASVRPYAFWVVGSPVAWGVMLGLPIAAAALRSLARANDAAIALAVVVIVAAVAGFTKAETERIWLFLVPLACVAAAPAITPRRVDRGDRRAGGPGARDRGALRHHLVTPRAVVRGASASSGHVGACGWGTGQASSVSSLANAPCQPASACADCV